MGAAAVQPPCVASLSLVSSPRTPLSVSRTFGVKAGFCPQICTTIRKRNIKPNSRGAPNLDRKSTRNMLRNGRLCHPSSTAVDHGRRPRPSTTAVDHGRRRRPSTTAVDHGRRPRPSTTGNRGPPGPPLPVTVLKRVVFGPSNAGLFFPSP